MLNAFSIDLEDYYHVTAFERLIDRRQWSHFESRIEASTFRLLRLLERHSVRATVFVLGWVARHFPGLIRTIQASGHEIGSHSYWHRLIYNLTPAQFRRDLRRSRRVIEDITEKPVTSYRAPSFSITSRSLWALDVLGEEGFTSDSSIFPVHHDRYGIAAASRFPHVVRTLQGAIREFPPATCRVGKLTLAVGGGGYFRLYPVAFTCKLLAAINRVARQPFMFYVHPWELDPEQPRISGLSRATRIRHYVNLHSTEQKLDRLLQTFQFSTMSETLVAAQSLEGPAITAKDAAFVASTALQHQIRSNRGPTQTIVGDPYGR
jgi:polysaccharide deacetylase family protein (PEP-CTERM system associated)